MSKELKEILAETPVRIGVLGAIGSGKSTLTEKLSKGLGIEVIHENFPANPYLEDFYASPKDFSFKSQLWFLRSTADQMVEISKKIQGKSIILDPANEMNFIYAQTHRALGWMSEEEFRAYQMIYKIVNGRSEIKKPDVFLWLAPPDMELTQRVLKRNRPYEMRMLNSFPHYLSYLNSAVIDYAQKTEGEFVFVDSTEDFTSPLVIGDVMKQIRRRIKP